LKRKAQKTLPTPSSIRTITVGPGVSPDLPSLLRDQARGLYRQSGFGFCGVAPAWPHLALKVRSIIFSLPLNCIEFHSLCQDTNLTPPKGMVKLRPLC
jgi:hypothetical protein